MPDLQRQSLFLVQALVSATPRIVNFRLGWVRYIYVVGYVRMRVYIDRKSVV